MPKKSLTFIRTGLLTIIAFTALILTFNIVMDPYVTIGIPRTPGLNARKPAVLSQEHFIKAHEVLRAAPNTLITGSSPSDEGLDALDPNWPVDMRPVYNLAFMGSTPYVWLRYLQHTMAHRAISLVVIGLPADAFITGVYEERPKESEPGFEERLAVTAKGAPNTQEPRQNSRELIQSLLSFDAISDSFSTLIGNLDGDSFNTFAGNLELNSDRRDVLGTDRAFMFANIFAVQSYRDMQRSQYDSAMADLNSILDLCKSRGTRVILFVNPAHASRLEILDYLGYWTAYEDWKRDLVALAEQYSDSSPKQTVLWDFSGYDSYSTEPIPPHGHEMHWYTDSDHYSRALGHMEVLRIFGSGDPNFGTLLTHENLESHLAAIREQQREYRATHPEDVKAIRSLYDRAFNMPFYVAARNQ